MIVLECNSEKRIEKDYMMNLFDTFVKELPPLKECLDHLCTKKKQERVVPTLLHGISLYYKYLHNGLFFPYQDANKKTIPLMPYLGTIASASILKELRDPNKATSKILYSIAGEFSWEMTSR